METYDERFRVDAGGDVLSVTWDGNMFVAPSCGAQYANRSDAMRVELAKYLRACGEVVEEVEALVLEDYGTWLEDE